MAAHTIAVLFPHFDLRRDLTHEMAFEMVRGVRDEVNRLDIDAHFYGINDDIARFWRTGYRSYAGVTGFLAWGKQTELHRWLTLERTMPAVAMFHRPSLKSNAVTTDDAAGIAMTADHLVKEGATTMGFLALRDDVHTRRRFAAFRTVLARHRIPMRDSFLSGFTISGKPDSNAMKAAHIERYSTAEHAYIRKTIGGYLSQRPLPHAVICENDYLACHFLAVAESLGVAVPKDIAVAGFDNFRVIETIPTLSKQYRPVLTSVDQDCGRIARESVRMLYGIITQQLPVRGNIVVIEPTLVIRTSSCRRTIPEGNGKRAAFKTLVQTFISRYFSDPSHLKNIAGECGMTYRSFQQKFKRDFGVTFTDHVSAYRMERAADMLRTTDKPVTRIIIETGYGSYQNFLKSFRKRYSTSPLEYRRSAASR